VLRTPKLPKYLGIVASLELEHRTSMWHEGRHGSRANTIEWSEPAI
jgi:hypothetical protein